MSSRNHNNVIDANMANFQTEVIQRSHEIPVLVDFWAPWCGPCRMLGPVLEKLASEPGSKFLLAKVNSDINPQLSMQFGIRGIPAVKAFRNGQVVDEFVGAQPEPRVRQFVDRLTAGFQPKGPAQSQASKTKIDNSSPVARLDQARQLLRQGNGCGAQTQLQNFPAGTEANAAAKLLPLAQFLCQMSRGDTSGGPADLSLLYRQVADAVKRREYAGAMYNLLAILRQDAHFANGRAQQVMDGLFELLGASDPTVQAYRQQMTTILGA